MGLQIILSLLIFVAIFRLCAQFYKRHINTFFFFFFLMVWCVILFLNWNIGILNRLGNLLGIEHGATALVYVALFFLFYYVSASIIMFYRIEQEIDKLVKKDAVKDFVKRHGLDRKG